MLNKIHTNLTEQIDMVATFFQAQTKMNDVSSLKDTWKWLRWAQTRRQSSQIIGRRMIENYRQWSRVVT